MVAENQYEGGMNGLKRIDNYREHINVRFGTPYRATSLLRRFEMIAAE